MCESKLEAEVNKLTRNMIPMHMPGHKRMLMPSERLPYDLDITEISGADDLHDAGGILRDAMERASRLWGSGRTWFLVGGSTCGILAGIRAAVPFGGEIIAARNCHRSVFHAIELGGYKVHWILPAQYRRAGICGGITRKQVRDCIVRHPGSAAVIVTSPTYEGVVSDIRSIAEVCHGAGIPLLVDEAHGAHLGLFEEGGFPTGAVRCGADLVVQSVHKTLPSLTQTALLHLQGSMIRSKEMERQLGIFETSSPSYPLMISIDSCTELLAKAGPELFGVWKERLDRFYDAVRPLRYVRVWDPDSAPESGTKSGAGSLMNRDRRDRSKIWISFRRAGLSGAEAAALLRERYGIETEMCSGDCVLAMTGCGDTDEDLHRLSEALRAVDSEAAGRERTAKKAAPQTALPPVQTACTILAAVGCEAEEVDMDEAEGRICGEYLYAYPPGIPILAPGEYIGQEHIRLIRKSGEDGNPVHHTHADHPDRIMCLAE